MLDFLLGGILTGSTMQRQKESMLSKHLVQTQRKLVLTEILPLTVATRPLLSASPSPVQRKMLLSDMSFLELRWRCLTAWSKLLLCHG